MLTTIDFDDEPPFATDEIDVVTTNRLLPDKLKPWNWRLGRRFHNNDSARVGKNRSDLARSAAFSFFPRMLCPSPQPSPRERGKGVSPVPRDLVVGEVFEDADQARMVPALAAERGGGIEQFLRRRGVGQG
jgi:hypothetical protein